MRHSFVKDNTSGLPDAPQVEARGLRALAEGLRGQPLQVPDVIRADNAVLETRYIAQGAWTANAWQQLGAGLACLHAVQRPHFGYAEDNYIGRNPQKNTLCDNWGHFFLEYRLGFQVALIVNRQMQEECHSILSSHGQVLADYLSSHRPFPSLVHGDLWRGNVLCDRRGQPWLIDPAVYWGDREVDIAMTELFGGFDSAFYRTYGAELPLAAGYETRREIYNLYHYLNHYNLFGEGYLAACRRGFERILRL